MDFQQIIDDIYQEVLAGNNAGKTASYIPELSKVSPDKFGVCLSTIDGKQYKAGDCQEKFSIQSIAKVLSLSLAYQILGENIWTRVDVEPSGTAFNSLVQLETESGIPRNPFINAGAIVVCDILCSHLNSPHEDLLKFIQNLVQNPDIQYSKRIAASEKSEGYRNYALVNFLRSFGNIKNDCEYVVDFYFHLCSIEMTCVELSNTFLFLANQGKVLANDQEILSLSKTKRINAIMSTCGFYDEAGEFAYKVGLPGKSGVGGGIAAVLPNKYSVSVWSPKLNHKGNSYRGMKFLELFTTRTETSIF